MSKKKKLRTGKKNVIEFEMENSTEEIAARNVEKIEAGVAEIKEAEVETIAVAGVTEEMVDEGKVVVAEESKKEKNKRRDVYIEFVLIFVLGVLIGVALKTEAIRRITIGFNDYQMKTVQQDFDINKIQAEVTKKTMEEADMQTEAGTPEGDGGAEAGE